MKPLIYFDFEECRDKDSVIIRKCRLEEVLNEVYQAGYEDGSRRYPIPTYPYISTINNKLKSNSDDLGKRSNIKITCNADESVVSNWKNL